jgi:hypothetical protein
VTTVPQPWRPEQLDDELRQRVLRPYKPHCRYVLEATLSQAGNGMTPRASEPSTWIRIDTQCTIAEPCYIEATGHLNAVEFNITYNQMLYLGLAETVRRRLVPELAHWGLDDFFRAQLPDVLIGDYHARFHRPMLAASFRGWLTIVEVKPRPQRNLLLLRTRAGCTTDAGGECEGEVTIALVNWHPA